MAASTYSPAQGTERGQRQQQMRRLSMQPDWDRSDGRSFIQCRPAFLRTGAANAASGSAYAEFGNTKVIVSVFGPRESKKAMMYSDIGRLNCNATFKLLLPLFMDRRLASDYILCKPCLG